MSSPATNQAESNNSPNHHSDQAGHSHGLTRGEDIEGVSDSRLLWSVALNQLLTVGQVIAGIYSGSVALLSDAAHNFNDANALLIAWFARRISKRKSNERYTFGYRRAELIGAVINLTLLGVIGLYLVYEGISRFFAPQEIIGWLMAAAAVLALIVDVGTALLLWAMSKGSLNVKAAFIHNMVDALGSLAVLIGAGAVIYLDWQWIDPVLTLVISGYVLWQVVTMLPQAIRILMEGTPTDLNLQTMVSELQKCDKVEDLHHIHVWQLDEEHKALEAHVVITRENAGQLERIKNEIKERLHHDYGITHSTLEFEYPDCSAESGHDNSLLVDH